MKFCDANPYIRFAQRFFFKRHKVIFNVFDCRIMYILKGCLDIVIEGQKHCLSDDSLFYCPSGSVYEISSVDGCDICVLNFDFDTQRKFKASLFKEMPITKLSMEEIYSIKEAVARDQEATDFVLEYMKQTDGSKNALNKMQTDDGASI